MCIPRATGDKGGKRISPHTLGTRYRATTCHKQEEGAFPLFHISSQGFVVGCFNYPLGEVQWKDSNLQHRTGQANPCHVVVQIKGMQILSHLGKRLKDTMAGNCLYLGDFWSKNENCPTLILMYSWVCLYYYDTFRHVHTYLQTAASNFL